MNDEVALWNEISGIFMSRSDTDEAVLAYQSGDHAELGRIIAIHIKRQMDDRAIRKAEADAKSKATRYDLTDKGKRAVDECPTNKQILTDIFGNQAGMK